MAIPTAPPRARHRGDRREVIVEGSTVRQTGGLVVGDRNGETLLGDASLGDVAGIDDDGGDVVVMEEVGRGGLAPHGGAAAADQAEIVDGDGLAGADQDLAERSRGRVEGVGVGQLEELPPHQFALELQRGRGLR